MIRPSIGALSYALATLVVGAIDQQVAHAGRSHFAECDFLLAGGFQTGPIECSINPLLSEIVLWNDADICDALQFWPANLPSCLACVAREPNRRFESHSLRQCQLKTFN
jgi:hypothetical protein